MSQEFAAILGESCVPWCPHILHVSIEQVSQHGNVRTKEETDCVALSASHRCWNYSVQVGCDHDHPLLCERCAPVIRGMGFELPDAELSVPEAAAVPL